MLRVARSQEHFEPCRQLGCFKPAHAARIALARTHYVQGRLKESLAALRSVLPSLGPFPHLHARAQNDQPRRNNHVAMMQRPRERAPIAPRECLNPLFDDVV